MIGPVIPDRPNAQKAALARLITQHVQNPVANYPSRFADQATAARMAEAQDQLLRQNRQVIPRGYESYRVPTDFDLERLPTQPGQSFRPGQMASVAGSSDLQALGRLLAGESGLGSQASPRQAAIMKILAMEDVPGVRNISQFASGGIPEEGLFGPKTRYEVLNYRPAVGGNPAVWNLGAYANMGLGAANILGFLPTLLEAGNIMTGRSQQFRGVGGMN